MNLIKRQKLKHLVKSQHYNLDLGNSEILKSCQIIATYISTNVVSSSKFSSNYGSLVPSKVS